MHTFFGYKPLHVLIAAMVALSLFATAQPLHASASTQPVLIDNLQPSWTAPGGGGVFSAYRAAGTDSFESPGATALHDGREAGIIKAGLTTAAGDWDEGLFGFKPTGTINDFAAQPLTYDVENQEGSNPVWMTIEIDTGTPGDRSDNTTYQHVPPPYGAGWHTVDAGAGQWQKWDDNNGTVTQAPISLAEVVSANTGLDIVRAYLRLGMGDSYQGTGNGTIGWVDQASIGGVVYDFVVPHFWYVSTTGSDSNEGSEISPFLTIQHAVDSASDGDTIHIAAGTYVENVIINKGVTLAGTGQAATIIKPAVSNPNCGGGGGGSLCGGGSNVLLVQADNVTIHDLTVDGDNPALTSGIIRNTTDVDARNGIITNHNAGNYTNLTVHHVTVQNIYLRGIYASTDGTFNFHDNTVTNVQGDGASIGLFAWYGPGVMQNNTVSYANDAISANHSRGIQFLNNTVTHSGSGVHTDNGGETGWSGSADLIQGNTISDCMADGYGIFVFVPYRPITVDNNTITNCSVGLSAWGSAAPVTVTFSNNTVNGPAKAAGSVGAYIATDEISWGYADVAVAFSGNTITNNETGVELTADSQSWNPVPWESHTINAAFHTNKIYGNTNGVHKGSTGTIVNDFVHNWWGTGLGPDTPDNTYGNGDSVVAGIVYSPWCEQEACSTFAPPFHTTTTITSDAPDPSLRNQNVTIQFNVASIVPGTPTLAGTVDVTDGTNVICHNRPIVSGTGSCVYAFTAIDNYILGATFTPTDTALFAGSSDTEPHSVVNAAPVITEGTAIQLMLAPDAISGPHTLQLHATDANNDVLTWDILTDGVHGTANTSGAGTQTTVTYTPSGDFVDSDSFVVRVSDGIDTDTITVNVNVSAANHGPVIAESNPTAVSMAVNGNPTPFSLTLHATDPDSGQTDTLVWSIASSASHGIASATGTGGTRLINYAPNHNYAGSDSFVVQAQDTGGLTASVTVNVTVSRPTKTLISSAANDGWILELGENGNVGGKMNATAQSIIVGDDPLNQQYRSILSFNTKLPTGAVITKVTLMVKRSGAQVRSPFSVLGNIAVDIKKGTFGTPALQLSDFQTAATRVAGMTIKNTPAAGQWYSSNTLTGAQANNWISKTGNTQFRLRFATDDNNNRAANQIRFFSGNAAAGYQPQLVIEYYVP